MNRFFLLSFFLLFASLSFVHSKETARLDSLLTELDKAILSDKYKVHKENEVASLKYRLNKQNLKPDEQYYLYAQLTAEYEFYRCDSAYRYAQKQYAIAQETEKEDFIIESKIQLAAILFKIAMFNEAVDLLSSIDEKGLSEEQRFNYYKTFYEIYVLWVDFYDEGYESEEINNKHDYYYEEFLKIIPQDTFEYASYHGIKYIIIGEYDKAEKILNDYLCKVKLGSRQYSILTSVLSFLASSKEEPEKVKEYLALSALSDIHGNIMENASLRELATILFDEGKIHRANSYIKRSMEDANFYNARIRNNKISRVLPIIDNAYQMDKAKQQKKLEQLLVIISLLSLFLLVGIFFIIRQMKKLSKAQREISAINKKLKSKNEALADINLTLADTNHIKEEYIGHFLGLCSLYIEKMEKYQRKLFNKAKTSTAEELYKTIKSTQFIKDEREEFYNTFDDSFLKLFPNFVEEFNALLPEEEKVTLKVNEKLSTELRIFALIRLGINDSTKIAEFLNYSLATIYNYRSRFRNKSIVPRNEFENEIMKIGTGYNAT